MEKLNNPCWSFAKGSCQFGDACKYLHNGVHGKSTLLPRTSGSASSVPGVPGVTRSDSDMLQSLLAKFGLNAPNISTPSPPVAYTVSVPPGFQSVSAQLSAQPTYVSPQLLPGSFGVSNMGMAGLFLQGVQYPTGSPQQGGSPLYVASTTWTSLRRLVSSDSISCNKEKLPVLYHACQLGKHVKLPFVSSSSSVTSCFDIVHSDLWTSPIPSLSFSIMFCF
ncbi:ribonuclease H-like domain-containing protein [Tanacetum coccineum]